MKLDLERLRANYETLNDEAFQQELLLGPGAYASLDVWSILLAEAECRGIDRSLIPQSADDPLVALARFEANIQVIDGDFETPAHFRPDKKLILIRRGESEEGIRNRIVQLDVTREILRVEILKPGAGAWASALASSPIGTGLFARALVAGVRSTTGITLTTFSLALKNGETIVGKADPNLVAELMGSAPQ